MKTTVINSKFHEIQALKWRTKPLAASGRVVVYEPRVWGQQPTILVVYDDGTLWSSAIAWKPSDGNFYSASHRAVTIYPHDPEFSGLFHCLVKAGLISKRTSDIVMKAMSTSRTFGHPGNIGDHRMAQFESDLKTYGTPGGMKRAKRHYKLMIEKNVDNAIEEANKEFAKRKADEKAKQERAAKRKAAAK